MHHRPALAQAAHGLHIVPLNLVDIEAQERKTSGLDAASLAELASSIQRDGLMQPPLLRWKGSRLVVVAGERRIRACRMVGLAAVHAIVGEADDKRARLLRLAENHQRENLSTAETAAAVKEMADEGMSLAEIATAFSKSKAWASKHIGVSREDFSQRARFLLEHGHCEDLEKLHILSQLELATATKPGRLVEIAQQLNEISRTELRLILKKAKTQGEDEEVEEEDEDEKPAVSAKPPSTKTAKLQLDESTAVVILEALSAFNGRNGTGSTQAAFDFVRKFVHATWPDAIESQATTPKEAPRPIQDIPIEKRGRKTEKAQKTRAAMKYRDARTGETWSGRGLMPRWLKAAIAEGRKLTDFETHKA
jgi:ParB/RepB/Spo0J family partition protein